MEDQLIKGTETSEAKAPDFKEKSFTIEKAAISGNSITVIASKEIEDRDGDIIRIAGIDTGNFTVNPVILWNHKPDYVIGKCTGFQKSEQDGVPILLVTIEFWKSEQAQDILAMFKEGFLNTVSVRIGIKQYSIMENHGLDIQQSELIEVSAVALPANPEAVILRSMEQSGKIKQLEKRLAEMDAIYNRIENLAKSFGAGRPGNDSEADVVKRIAKIASFFSTDN